MGSRSEWSSDMVVPRSIQAALELGALGVIVRCGTCLNVAKFSAARAIRLFGADTLVVDVAKKCRCRCGARAKYSVADWKRYSRGGGPPEPLVPKAWGRLP